MSNIWSAGISYKNPEENLKEMLERKDLGQGWESMDFTKQFQNGEITLEDVKKVAERESDENAACTFKYMFTEIKPGDYVFMREGSRIPAIGIVKGTDYTYWENAQYYPNRIGPIEWFTPRWLREYQSPVVRQNGIVKINKNIDKAREIIARMNMTNILDRFKGLLLSHRQIILTGPPGTGKTYLAKRAAEEFCNAKLYEFEKILEEGTANIVQFHPSYNYEDFVRGIKIRTKSDNGKSAVIYESVNRIFGNMAQAAVVEWEKAIAQAKQVLGENAEKSALIREADEKVKNFVLIIDEINRANLAAVFGELIYALEYRDEWVSTPYEVDIIKNDQVKKTDKLKIPPNLYIIGTMNTADRSIGYIDYAVRRRFAFVSVLPDDKYLEEKGKKLFDAVSELFEGDNNHLSPDFHKDDVQPGHTYFMIQEDENAGEVLPMKFTYQVYPLLREYYKDGVLIKKSSSGLNILNGEYAVRIDEPKPAENIFQKIQSFLTEES